MVHRRDARAGHRALLLGKRRAVPGRRRPGRQRRLEVVRIVVAPVVDARREGDAQIGRRGEDVLDERAGAPLGAARHPIERRRQPANGVVRTLLAVAVHAAPIDAGRQEVLGSDRPSPLSHRADIGRGHALIEGNAADVPGNAVDAVHGEEVAAEGLVVAEHPYLEVARVGERDAGAGADRRPSGVVGLLGERLERADLAVVAVFAEVARPDERAEAAVHRVVRLDVHVLEVGRDVVVDRSAFGGGDVREAVGIEEAPVDRQPEIADDMAAEQVELPRPAVADLRLRFDGLPSRAAADDVDDAAHAVVAVDARARPFDDLDAIDGVERQAAPVHPSAERIVDGNIVDEHERAADAARPDPAQRDTLRRRMRGQAAGTPEQAEGRELAEQIVRHDGGRLPNLGGIENRHAGGDVTQPLLGPRGGDGDLLENRCGREDDLHLSRPGQRLTLFGESASPDDERRLAFGGFVDRESAVWAGDGLLFCRAGRLHGDRGAGDGAATRVLDDAGDRRRGKRQRKKESEKHQSAPFLERKGKAPNYS